MADVHTVIPRTLSFVFYKDEVLLLKGNRLKDWNGIYDPVGGHIEKGESIIDSAAREIEEESGLDVVNIKLRGIVHVSDFFGKNIILFVTSSQAKTKKVVGSEEGTPEWIKIKELDKIRLFEDIKPILKHLFKIPEGKIFIGTSQFDGKEKLLALDISLV